MRSRGPTAIRPEPATTSRGHRLIAASAALCALLAAGNGIVFLLGGDPTNLVLLACALVMARATLRNAPLRAHGGRFPIDARGGS